MRGRLEEIKAAGADLIAIGTGNARYARAFIEDEKIPFPVLLDDDAEAAKFASVRKTKVWQTVMPESLAKGAQAFSRGHRQHHTGKRGLQLGATFVVGPGNVVRYEYLDDTVYDHAPLDDVLAALRS